MSSAVQFRGRDQVLGAFENRDVDAWSMWAGSQFLFKGIGIEKLEKIFDLMEGEQGASNAVYTIKVYEDIADEKKIKSNTQHDGSFNFRLNGEHMLSGTGIPSNQNWKFSDQLAQLQEEIRLLKQPPPPEEEEEKTIGSVLMDVLSNPSKAVQWAEIIKGFFSATPAAIPALPAARNIPAVMGNTTPAATPGSNPPETLDEKLERISAALDILGRNDPKICEHLEKLAAISTKNPVHFNWLRVFFLPGLYLNHLPIFCVLHSAA